MGFRKIFDTIPAQFDKRRPRYSQESFDSLIEYAKRGPEKTVLEIGPGTGQATDPILETGCDYHAIEPGEHLYEMMKRNYDRYPNFHIANDDFITHAFGEQWFDLIYSAARIAIILCCRNHIKRRSSKGSGPRSRNTAARRYLRLPMSCI